MAVRVGYSSSPRCESQEGVIVVASFSRKQYQIGLRAAPTEVAQQVSTVSDITG